MRLGRPWPGHESLVHRDPIELALVDPQPGAQEVERAMDLEEA